jgi:hypothetical protein
MRRKRNFYLFQTEYNVVLSGWETKEMAEKEKEKMEEEIPSWKGKLIVLSRDDPEILEYARTHPAFAKREGLKV